VAASPPWVGGGGRWAATLRAWVYVLI
jgi:hypothetical protein